MKTSKQHALTVSRTLKANDRHTTIFEDAVVKLIILVTLVTLATPAWSLTTNQRVALLEEYVVSLKDRVAALEAANTSLVSQVTTLNNQLASLSATNSALADRVGNLEAGLNTMTNANTALTERIALLETDGSAAKNQMAVLQSDLGAVKNNSVLALDQKLVIQNGDAVFQGVNVQIVNGMKRTDSVNGKGNLIIGYNESDRVTIKPFCSFAVYKNMYDCVGNGYLWGSHHREGSHNIISGINHNYTQYGGAVFGFANIINAPWSTVTGGAFNRTHGAASSVSGGAGNIASGENASVSGGSENVASGIQASVTGGSSNSAAGLQSSVSGGNHRSTINSNEWAAGGLLEHF